MTTKHTPGPWRTVPSTAGGGTVRLDVVSDGAEFSPSYVGGDMLPEDARLIAVAPELLAALKAIKRKTDESRDFRSAAACAAIAQAALVKATGN